MSDEERREVARRLREKKREFFAEGCFYPQDLTLYQSLYLKAIEECLPEGDCGFDILADLIDRPTCRNVYDEVYDEYEGGCCENGFKCSKCGELVEDCEGYRVKGTFNYCPNCGAEVVPDGC